jgi:hypothetical protein
VHVMLVTLVMKFSKQSYFMLLCSRYVGDVGNQVHLTGCFMRLSAIYVDDVGNQVQ